MANENMVQNAEVIKKTAIIEEDANMANENVIAEAIETTETPAATLPKFNDVIIPADEDREMLLITATRNKNDAMFWNYITVPAGTDPREFIKTITENKFVNLVDARNVRAFIEAGAPLRGMASTVADFAARYAKTKGEVTDKAALVLREFTDIIAQVDAGTLEGRWDNPEAIAKAEAKAKEEADKAAAKAAKEAEKAAKKAAAEAPAEDEVEDPFDVAE